MLKVIFLNEGWFAEQDGWIYCSLFDSFTCDTKDLHKVNIDGTQRTQLTDDVASYTNVVGDWICYSNIDDFGTLYKIRTDGSQQSKIIDKPTSNVHGIDNWIYYLALHVDTQDTQALTYCLSALIAPTAS